MMLSVVRPENAAEAKWPEISGDAWEISADKMSLTNLEIRPFREFRSDLAKIIGLYSKTDQSHKDLCFIASLPCPKVRSHISKPHPGIVVKGKERDERLDKLEAAVKKLKIAIKNLDPKARSYFSTTFRVNPNEENEIWPSELLDSWVLEISKFRVVTSTLPRSGANPREICVAAGGNRPFVKGRKAADMALVRARRYECDWQAVGAHWQEFQRNNLVGMRNTVKMMKQSQWQTYDVTPVNSAPATTSTGGYLKSQSFSGQMRYY